MLNSLFNQVGQLQRPRRLLAIHGWRLPTPHTLEKVLQFCIQRLDGGRAHLLDESIIAVEQLSVISGIPLMGPAMNVQVVVEEVGLHQA